MTNFESRSVACGSMLCNNLSLKQILNRCHTHKKNPAILQLYSPTIYSVYLYGGLVTNLQPH